MSNDSSPPPKGGKGSEPPGLVSRSPRGGIFDAIPTEAEGDALFDELFGGFDDEGETSLEVEDYATSEGDRPTAEVPLEGPGEPVAFDAEHVEDREAGEVIAAAAAEPRAADEDAQVVFDEDVVAFDDEVSLDGEVAFDEAAVESGEILDEDTRRPVDSGPPAPARTGPSAPPTAEGAAAEALGYQGAPPPDWDEDSGDYDEELPIPGELPDEEATAFYQPGEVPYAAPYDLPEVEDDTAEPAIGETRPGPSVIPGPPPRREGYQQSAGELPLEGLGEPVPSFEEIEIPRPPPTYSGDALDLDMDDEGEEELAVEDYPTGEIRVSDVPDAAAGETAPGEVSVDEEDDVVAPRAAVESIIPDVVSEPPPEGVRLSIDDLALIGEAEEEVAVDVEAGVAFVDEGEGLDAVVSLMQQDQRDAWIERASWLYEEAPDPSQPRERSRALVVISELYAMAGEDERAESVAQEALELSPTMPMAHRQARGIFMARARWTEAMEAFDDEARVAPTSALKAHASYLGAELSRLALGDPDGAHRRLDQAERAAPDDLRVGLARAMEALAADDVPPADVPAAFREALEVIRILRTDGGEGEAGEAPHAVLLRARNALRRREMTKVVAALRVLEQHPSFSVGAAWLVAAIGAADESLRVQALEALARAVEGSHGGLASRARVARALELGEADVVVGLASSASDDVLAPAERAAIVALAGRPERAEDWLDAIEAGDQVAIALAVRAAASPAAAAARIDHDRLALGRLLAVEAGVPAGEESGGLSPTVVARAQALADEDEAHGVARALLLEHAHASGQGDRVAELLGGDAVSHDRAMFAALLAEVAGDRARMAECLESALADAPADLAAARMSMTVGDTVTAANALIRFADVAPDPVQAAIALTEAGLRLMEEEGQEADGEALLRRAAEQHPELPVAPFIGMYIAQALEDADGEAFWLEQRKAVATDPADYVPDMIRRASTLGEGEAAERASLLEEAHRARPDDYGLRDLYEQSVGIATDRAAWLMERVEGGGADAATAALEAALAAELDGDVALAASSLATALETAPGGLVDVFAERYARLGQNTEAAIARLEGVAEAEADRARRAERWLQIAGLAGYRDPDRALEALRNALTERPDHLPTLHAISAICRREAITDGLGGVALAIARQLGDAEGVGHAQLSARLHLESGKWEDTYEAVKLAYAAEDRGVWALRQMAAHARARGDHGTAADCDRELAAMATEPRDQATLLLRAAEGAFASGDGEAAAERLREALDRVPRHPVALLQRAAHLERAGEPLEAARAWEELAQICQSPRERAAKLYRAAVLWLGLEGAVARAEGRRLLEAVSQIDASYGDTFERLRALYVAEGAKRELADLLASRLDQVDDPDERLELEILRGRTLVEAGDASEARDALRAALEASPDNVEALRAYADVCAAEQDWEGVEQAIIRLGRLVSEPEEQIRIHLRLGEIYAKHLPNPDRAEAAYESVLAKSPDHVEAQKRLVSLYLDRGDTAKAFAQQEKVIAAAKTPTVQCEATVRLAEIHAAAGDTKQAEQILMKARRQWSKEPSPVAALYRFYQESAQDQAAEMLLERAAADVRRGLGAGRFEAPLFAMAQMVAEMRGQPDMAHVAQATLAAIRGRPSHVEGVGARAGDASLDDEIAPELFTPALRQLLARTGGIMDAAAPFDLGSLRARPLTATDDGNVLFETQELAAAYGLPDVQVYVTNALGRVCVPAQTNPPTLCFGLALVTAEEDQVRTFLTHRALKVIQTGAAALSRTAPIDLWPLFAAYLKVHSPSFAPQGVDAQKVAAYHARMVELGLGPDPQLSLLTSEVIGSIGNRASSLAAAANAWGSRAAMLALGDPSLALTAIAWAGGATSGPPDAGPERLRWIGRQAEARDLIVFSVSDGYASARARLGVEAPVSLAAEEILFDEEIVDVDLDD